MSNYLIGLVLSIPGLLLALSMHEFAHGYAAYKMGDNTAKYSGRLSINPFDHLDPIGTLCLFLFRFGWAKPVPINPYNFKNQRKGTIIVSLAGPLMNFFIAFASAFLMEVVRRFMPMSKITDFIWLILYYSELLNIGFMVFNLIPIPPLDGSKILLELLPYRYRNFFYQIERYSTIILVLIVGTNVLSPALSTARMAVGTFISMVIGLIF